MSTRRNLQVDNQRSGGEHSRTCTSTERNFYMCKPIMKIFQPHSSSAIQMNSYYDDKGGDIWREARQQATLIRERGLSQFDPMKALQETLRDSISIDEVRCSTPPSRFAVQLRPLPVVYSLHEQTSRGVTGQSTQQTPSWPSTGPIRGAHSQERHPEHESWFHTEPSSASLQGASGTHNNSDIFQDINAPDEQQHAVLPTTLYSNLLSRSHSDGLPERKPILHFSERTKDATAQGNPPLNKMSMQLNLWRTTPHTSEGSEPSNYFDVYGGAEYMKEDSPWPDANHQTDVIVNENQVSLETIRQRALAEAPPMDSSSSDSTLTIVSESYHKSSNINTAHNTQCSRDEFFSFKEGSPQSNVEYSPLF